MKAAAGEPCVRVVDDDGEIRDSLQRLISSIGVTVRTYPSAIAFLEGLDGEVPGCALVDQRMPLMGGLSLQRVLIERQIPLPVIITTDYPDVQVAVSAMKLGAFDFLLKPLTDTELIAVVQSAIRKDADMRSIAAERAAFVGKVALLTPRERQVMEQLLLGQSYKAIAEKLDITKRTVELHRLQVMKKIGVTSIASLVALVTFFREEIPTARETLPPSGAGARRPARR